MSAAATAVFTTFELLENILINLPAKDIACSQLLCRQVKPLVDRSPTLQQKLFLKPAAAQAYLQWKWQPRTETNWTHNNTIIDAIPVLLPRLLVEADRNIADDNTVFVLGKLHPALDDHNRVYDSALMTHFDLNQMLRWAPGGAWERMFVTQPPTQQIALVFATFEVGKAVRNVIIQDREGVRLVAIRNALRDELPRMEREEHWMPPGVHYLVRISIHRFAKDTSAYQVLAQYGEHEGRDVAELRKACREAREEWLSIVKVRGTADWYPHPPGEDWSKAPRKWLYEQDVA